MNSFIIIVIIILNIFLKYVLGFINNIIIILVINSTSVHVFLKECKRVKKANILAFSEKSQNIGLFLQFCFNKTLL